MKFLLYLIVAGTVFSVTPLSAGTLDQGAVEAFIEEMAAEHEFDVGALNKVFAGAERSERILELMTRPAEKVKPWWEYRRLFISDRRTSDGVRFWREHAEALQRATEQYGVPAEVIVAIIGVETSYGRAKLSYRVIDALSTLAFHYPGGSAKRSAYFRSQLAHFLLFAREGELDPFSVYGSYAGAMGMPQFMPENYRKLAVDFDADGTRDIWKNAVDAIGSVANYLNFHGWEAGGPIMTPASVGQAELSTLVQDGLKPAHTLGSLAAAGVTPMRRNDDNGAAAALYELEAENGQEYWIGYTNFYVISRYNPRLKYTMAVAQLAAAIRDQHEETPL